MEPRTEKQVLDGLSFDASAHDRMDVVEELGHANGILNSEFIEQTLVRVLREDPNPIVRHEAAFSLGSLHCGGSGLSPVSVDALCEAAQCDSSVVVRHEATEALGSICVSKVRKVLKLVVRDPHVDVVETAYISLGRHEQALREPENKM